MNKTHKSISVVILLLAIILSYWLDAEMTEGVSRNLVTFFSVVFGFYMTSIAILVKTKYTKILYNQIDEKAGERGIHKLKNYLLIAGRCSIFSIVLIIVFTLLAHKNSLGNFEIELHPLSIPFVDFSVNLDLAIRSFIFGISAVNVFFMLLIFHTILDGMVEESKAE